MGVHPTIVEAVKVGTPREIQGMIGLFKSVMAHRKWGDPVPEYFQSSISDLGMPDSVTRLLTIRHERSYETIRLNLHTKHWGVVTYDSLEMMIAPLEEYAIVPSLEWQTSPDGERTFAELRAVNPGGLLGLAFLAACSPTERKLIPAEYRYLPMEQLHMPLWLYVHRHILAGSPLLRELEGLATGF